MKAAPSQQTSLLELWKKQVPKKEEGETKASLTGISSTKGEQLPALATPTDAHVMDVDARSSRPPESSRASTPDLERPAKRKAASPMSADEDEEPIVKPFAKKRKVITSDDEDDEPLAVTRRTPKKRTKKSNKAQTKLTGKSASQAQESSSKKVLDIDPAEDDAGDDAVSDEEELAAVSTTAGQLLSGQFTVKFKGTWDEKEPAPYALLAYAFSLIEGTTKRIEKTCYLTSLLHTIISRSRAGREGADADAGADAHTLLQTVYLCINRLSPDYEGIELGIGESLLIKAISESTGRRPQSVKDDLKKEGDLGLVAMNSKASQRTLGLVKAKPLTVASVFTQLKTIATTTGHQSQAKKTGIISKLLAACQASIGGETSPEAKFIIRSLEGKLRIGLAERTVLLALAYAVVLDERDQNGRNWSNERLSAKLEEGSNMLKQVYSELPSYDQIIPPLLEHGIKDLSEHCKLTPGVPLKPMLAKPTKAIGEVLDRFEGKPFTCEYKYDGERAQVHCLEDGKVAVFSRNSEDMTKKYPELVQRLPKCIKGGTISFVLDAEAVAIDRTTGKLQPFQELSRRKRKDVKVEDITVQVCLFAFDLLFLNGEALLHRTLEDRRKLLWEHFRAVPFEFEFAKSSDGETTDEIQVFLEESVKDGCEGLMVKTLQSDESFYEPSRRSVNWLKLKKDYLVGVGDSLDLVVVGAYYGKGKRTAVYGAFLLACYDADSEEWQTICKIGTGFSDEALQTHHEALKGLELSKPRGDIKIGGAKPDVWFTPKVVWEVLTADLSLSPVYTAAQGLVDQRGISLRFPRFIRMREDKDADDATSPQQIAEMYERQALAQSKGKKKSGGGDADDGFW